MIFVRFPMSIHVERHSGIYVHTFTLHMWLCPERLQRGHFLKVTSWKLLPKRLCPMGNGGIVCFHSAKFERENKCCTSLSWQKVYLTWVSWVSIKLIITTGSACNQGRYCGSWPGSDEKAFEFHWLELPHKTAYVSQSPSFTAVSPEAQLFPFNLKDALKTVIGLVLMC